MHTLPRWLIFGSDRQDNSEKKWFVLGSIIDVRGLQDMLRNNRDEVVVVLEIANVSMAAAKGFSFLTGRSIFERQRCPEAPVQQVCNFRYRDYILPQANALQREGAIDVDRARHDLPAHHSQSPGQLAERREYVFLLLDERLILPRSGERRRDSSIHPYPSMDSHSS